MDERCGGLRSRAKMSSLGDNQGQAEPGFERTDLAVVVPVQCWRVGLDGH